MKPPPTSPKRPPALDEPSFQKLLEAAFVMQQHSERQGEKKSLPDFNSTLSSIVETHKLIQSGQFDFQTATSLVAQQAQKMTGATGVAIGMAERDRLLYVAGTGIASADVGVILPLAACVSADCFIQGKLLQYADNSANSSAVSQAWAVRGVKALIAAPVYQKGKIAGVVELRLAKANSLQSGDVGTAQLMAGLVSEAMMYARPQPANRPAPEEPKNQTSARQESGQLFDPLPVESLFLPDLETEEVFPAETPIPAQPPWPQAPPDRVSPTVPPDLPASQRNQEPPLAMPPTTCHSCSNPLEEGEAFCGLCGSPRPGQASRSVQSNWASLWRMQQAAAKNPATAEPAPEIPAPPVPPRAVESGPAAASPDFEKMSPNFEQTNARFEKTLPSLEKTIPRSEKTTPSFEKTISDSENPASDFERLIEAASKPTSVIKPGTFPPPRAQHPSAAAFEQSVEIDKPGSPQLEDPSFAPVSEPFASAPGESEVVAADHATAGAEASRSEIRIVMDEPADEADDDAAAGMEPVASPWTSAQRAHAWLEGAKGQKRSLVWLSRWWWRNRASVYVLIAAGILCVSVVMFVVSLTRASAVQSPPVAASHRRKAPPPPNLTLFEKFLVSIGLAEPPDAPVYNGNPNTKVWVDVHTALYYCPGAELYAKTQGGKMTTQHDAQQDQFEPANRKVCE